MLVCTQPAQSWHGEGRNGAAATGGQEAMEAAIATLKSGGNAADAAAVATLVMTVTDSTLVCLGGEVPIMWYDGKTRSVEVLCGQGAAPRLATREYFSKSGGIPSKGVESAAVPGTLDALLTLLDRHGTTTFAQTAQPALRLLDEGKEPWHADYAATLRRLVAAEQGAGKDRRRGLRLVADFFYRGPLAYEIDAWMRANGGLIRYSDLATHVTRIEEPTTALYRGHVVCKCGFWTQGPYLLQALQMLEGFDLRKMGHNRPDTVHVMVEAMKLALADRDVWFADPLFVHVPARELLAPDYIQLRRSLINMERASRLQQPGDPIGVKAALDRPVWPNGKGAVDKDTSTCVIADQWGNVVAATPSGFSGALAGKTGVWFGSRLQSFNILQGHPNCIEPGKRPRITLTPGLVLKDGKVVLAVSCAGGDQQDQALLQVIVNCLDFNMSPRDAVTVPRFGTLHFMGSFGQTRPSLGNVLVYPTIGDDVVKALQARGATVTLQETAWGRPVALRIDPATGVMDVAGDPKAKRNAGAY
jgi:gamma-glutamyltranspeptidase/glutathione hydrolase